MKAPVCALMAMASPLVVAPAVAADRTQYVVISFDGAGPISQWERSRALARETGAEFTYFLSCVFLLTPQTKDAYAGPRHGMGKSNVGFAASRDDVAARLRQIWVARMEGHEIASHGCGHFDGGEWTAAEWRDEFRSFADILRDAWTINGIAYEPRDWRRFAASEVTGFRAPYLSTNASMFAALAAENYAYDASGVSRGPSQPKPGAVRAFALPLIPEGPAAKPIIAMDYNLFVRHSGGFEKPSEAAAFEERTYRAFIGAFREQFHGKRIPLQLGFHFTLMNDGAYWRALERFAREACTQPEVRCVSYAGLLAATDNANGSHAAAD